MHSQDNNLQECTGDAPRRSLLARLHNWQDKHSWNEFYRNYHALVYSVARKSGLTEEESWDVVQETFITIAKQSHEHVYDPERGSFKAWLLHITHWRIKDQLRKRSRIANEEPSSNLPDFRTEGFEELWQREWKQNILRAAMENVKHKVSPRQFQIFDFYVLQEMETREVCRKLGVNTAQIYLAKHRVGLQLRHEIALLQEAER